MRTPPQPGRYTPGSIVTTRPRAGRPPQSWPVAGPRAPPIRARDRDCARTGRRSRTLNVAARDGVGLTTRHARRTAATARLVRNADHLVHGALLVGRRSDDDGARDVGAVAAGFSAEIESRKSPRATLRSDDRACGSADRALTPRSTGTGTLAALVAHAFSSVPAHSSSVMPTHTAGRTRSARPGRDVRGVLDERHLFGVLSFTKRFDQIDGRPPLPAGARLEQPLKVAVEQLCGLKTGNLNCGSCPSCCQRPAHRLWTRSSRGQGRRLPARLDSDT